MSWLHEDTNGDDESDPTLEDRTMWVRVNAFSAHDAVALVNGGGGDLDFSNEPRWLAVGDRQAALDAHGARGLDQPAVPAGYQVLVVRRAYLDDRNRTIDSVVAALGVSKPEAFFEQPDLPHPDPGLPALIQAQARRRELLARLSHPLGSAETRSQATPRARSRL